MTSAAVMIKVTITTEGCLLLSYAEILEAILSISVRPD